MNSNLKYDEINLLLNNYKINNSIADKFKLYLANSIILIKQQY